MSEVPFDTVRFERAIQRFDAVNATDPNRMIVDDVEQSKEVIYAKQMTRWQEKLYPKASEALRLAARCQHIKRWEIPRDSFPMDRVGYHHWRTTLYGFHAEVAGKILTEVGYDTPTIGRVQSLLKKERIKADAEAQALEDIICLVFLENYFTAFAKEHDDDKIVTILQRTWKKMSPVGHSAALNLQMPPEAQRLVERALA